MDEKLPQAGVRAVARLRVEFLIDEARTLADAEKMIDQWLRDGEEDQRLIEYRVIWENSDWAPFFT